VKTAKITTQIGRENHTGCILASRIHAGVGVLDGVDPRETEVEEGIFCVYLVDFSMIVNL
jgi:hypothetical protein